MLFRVYALSHATSRRRYGRGVVVVVVVVDHMQPTHDQTVPRRPDARAMTSTPPASVIYERGAPPPNPLPRRGSLTRRITHVIVIVFAFRPSPRCEFDFRATHYYPSPHYTLVTTVPRLRDYTMSQVTIRSTFLVDKPISVGKYITLHPCRPSLDHSRRCAFVYACRYAGYFGKQIAVSIGCTEVNAKTVSQRSSVQYVSPDKLDILQCVLQYIIVYESFYEEKV